MPNKKFEELEIENGFILEYNEAIDYLDWVAIEHAKAIMRTDESWECADKIFEDLYEMKKEIIENNYGVVEFYECPMSASNINISHMVREEEVNYAIQDVAEWVMNNLNTDEIPLMFKEKKNQATLENYVRHMERHCGKVE